MQSATRQREHATSQFPWPEDWQWSIFSRAIGRNCSDRDDLGAETNALEEIVQGKEIPARDAEQDDRRDQDRKHLLLSAVRFHMKATRTPPAALSSCRSHRLEQQLR